MKNVLKSVVVMVAVVAVASQATLAAFTASATITGNTFSTGNAELQLYKVLSGSPVPSNLTTSLDNLIDFLNIFPNTWSQDYLAKVRNTGTVPLVVSVFAKPTTANDALSNEIFVQVYPWNDNGNGVVDDEELGEAFNEPMTIAEWEGEEDGIVLGTLDAATTMPVVFTFTASDLVDDSGEEDIELQLATMTYDFVFNGETPAAPVEE